MKSEKRRRLYKGDSVTMMLGEMGYTERCCSNCLCFEIEEDEEEEESDLGWCKANRIWLQIDSKGRGCCEIHTKKNPNPSETRSQKGEKMKCPDLSPPGMRVS